MIEGVVPQPQSAIRARYRLRAVVEVWAWEALLAFLAAWPAASLVRAVFGRGPAGDAPLWDPGALALMAFLSREANGVRAAVSAAAVIVALGAIAGLIPMAALLASLANSSPEGDRIGTARALDAGVRAFRPMVRLLGTVAVGQALVIGLAVLLGEGVQAWTRGWLGEAGAQQAGLALGAVVGLGALALGLVHDLARTAVIRLELGAARALTVGARALSRAPLALSWSWLWRTGISLGLVLAASLVADRLGGAGGLVLLALAGVHQAVALARVGLRASWLAAAMRFVDHLTASDR